MTSEEKTDTLVIDTGVLVEYFHETELGNKFETRFLLDETIEYFYISPLVYTELLYIFCRKFGMEKASRLLQENLKDYLILQEEQLRSGAAEIKCRFGIALADCYSIAAANLLKCPVLMKREKELEHLSQEDLQVEIIYIDDL